MLLSAGYEPPQQLFVHGFLNLDNRKISKSLGNVLDPLDLVDEYGVDPVRSGSRVSSRSAKTATSTLDSFRERYERELANDLGNLLSRTTAMIARYRDGDLAPVPDRSGELAAAGRALHDDLPAALDRWDVTGALDTIWDYVRRLNRHVEQTKPWELAKDPDRAGDLDRALYELADGLRLAAVALVAYVPDTSRADPRGARAPVDVAWDNVAYGRTGALRDRGGAAALPADRQPAPAA